MAYHLAFRVRACSSIGLGFGRMHVKSPGIEGLRFLQYEYAGSVGFIAYSSREESGEVDLAKKIHGSHTPLNATLPCIFEHKHRRAELQAHPASAMVARESRRAGGKTRAGGCWQQELVALSFRVVSFDQLQTGGGERLQGVLSDPDYIKPEVPTPLTNHEGYNAPKHWARFKSCDPGLGVAPQFGGDRLAELRSNGPELGFPLNEYEPYELLPINSCKPKAHRCHMVVLRGPSNDERVALSSVLSAFHICTPKPRQNLHALLTCSGSLVSGPHGP